VIALGVQTWGTDVRALRRYWTAADALGFARVTYGDGLFEWTHDGWSMLGALAAATRVARIGPAVTYAFDPAAHHPSWLAKRAVTIDHLSGGRLDLRLGVGASDRATAAHWRGHGIPYPPAGERIARVAETVQIVRRLWRGDAVDFEGRYYTLRAARVAPRPVQRRGPPIWIAARGPQALAAVARHADGWEASYLSPAAFAAKRRTLGSLLAAAGRDPARLRHSIELDVVLAASAGALKAAVARFCGERRIHPGHALLRASLVGEPPAVTAAIRRYAQAGATDLMLGFADFPAPGMLETFAARVLPALGAHASRGAGARSPRMARSRSATAAGGS
jgi:alkanesulfonate monooxygenase SsuD/methylene tetrahydromethanopterin reductase-like flavin-dependent oxidoreductase (luciferase family)